MVSFPQVSPPKPCAVLLLPIKNMKYTALEEAYLLGLRLASSNGSSLVGLCSYLMMKIEVAIYFSKFGLCLC